MTLACGDAYSKLVEIVTVAGVKDRVGNSLLQIWKLRFGQKAKLLFRLWAQGLVKILKLKLRQELKQELGQFLLLMFCRGYEFESRPSNWPSSPFPPPPPYHNHNHALLECHLKVTNFSILFSKSFFPRNSTCSKGQLLVLLQGQKNGPPQHLLLFSVN